MTTPTQNAPPIPIPTIATPDPLAPRARPRAVDPDLVDTLAKAIAVEVKAVDSRVKVTLEPATKRRRRAATDKVTEARIETAHAYRRLIEAHADVHGLVGALPLATANPAAGWGGLRAAPDLNRDGSLTPAALGDAAPTLPPLRLPARWIVPGDGIPGVGYVVAVDVGVAAPDTVTVSIDEWTAQGPVAQADEADEPDAQADAQADEPPTVLVRASGPIHARLYYRLDEMVGVIRPTVEIPYRWAEPGDVVINVSEGTLRRIDGVKTHSYDLARVAVEVSYHHWCQDHASRPWYARQSANDTPSPGTSAEWGYERVRVARHGSRYAASTAIVARQIGTLAEIHDRVDTVVVAKARASMESARAKRAALDTSRGLVALHALTAPPEPTDSEDDRAARRRAARAALAD